MFVALNSTDFCNQWLFKEARDEPLITVSSFTFAWAIFQAVVTIYIWIFVPEKSHSDEVAESDGPQEAQDEEVQVYASQVPAMIYDILQNSNSLIFMGFMFATCASYMIDVYISSVYLTNDLNFSKEKLSFVKIISAPANILCAAVSSYASTKRPFTFLF